MTWKVVEKESKVTDIRQEYGGSEEYIEKMATESMRRPDDFGYWGDDDMFRTWGFSGIDLVRDATCLDKANWEAFHRDIVSEYPDDFRVENFGHWAVGSVDRTLVRVLNDEEAGIVYDNISDAFIHTLSVHDAIAEHCVLDETLLAEEEYQANISWIEWASSSKEFECVDTSDPSSYEKWLDGLIDNESYMCPDADEYPDDNEMLLAAHYQGMWSKDFKEFWVEFCDRQELEVPTLFK